MVDRSNSSHDGASRTRHRRADLSRTRLLAGYLAVFAVFIAVMSVTGVTSGSTPSATPADSASVRLAARGDGLFLTSCASCHGPQGAGTAVAPDIRNVGAALTDFMLRTGRMPLADVGQPVLRGPVQFDESDIQALVAYVSSLGSGPDIPDITVTGADSAAGRQLFVANCAACHGPAAGGGAVGGGFVAPGLEQADPKTVGEAVLTGPGLMPKFSFSPQQLDDIAAYVQFLRSAPNPGGASSPAVGPVTEGFIAGIALIGLLLVARWVAVRRDAEHG